METTNSDTTNDTFERVKAGAHDTVDRVADAANKAAETVIQKTEQMRNAEARLMEHARQYVHDNPVTSLCLAVAGGFILSRLLSVR